MQANPEHRAPHAFLAVKNDGTDGILGSGSHTVFNWNSILAQPPCLTGINQHEQAGIQDNDLSSRNKEEEECAGLAAAMPAQWGALQDHTAKPATACSGYGGNIAMSTCRQHNWSFQVCRPHCAQHAIASAT